MTTTITWGTAEQIIPTLMLGWRQRRPSGNVIHDILGEPSVALTLRRAGLRTGELSLFFASREAAFAAEAAHAQPRIFTIADTDVPEAGMRYILPDGAGPQLEQDDSRRRWVVTIPYQEVP